MKLLHWFTSAVLVFAGAPAVSSQAAAADFTMKIGTPTINDIQHEWMKRFEPRIEKRSNGAIEVELYPASQLGAVPRMIEGLQFGTVEALVTPSFFLSGLEKRNSILAATGLFNSMEHCRKTTADPEFRDTMFPIMEDRGIMTVAILCSAPQAFLTKDTVAAVDDLKGQKIRVLASPFEVKPMEAIGASPTPMPLGDVAPALQRGVIDGVSSLPIVFSKFKMHTIAKHITMTRLSYFAVPVYVSKKWFDGLPAELQAAVLEEAKAVEGELAEWADAANDQAMEEWKAAGGLVGELSEAEQKKLQDAATAATLAVLETDPELKEFYGKLQSVAARH